MNDDIKQLQSQVQDLISQLRLAESRIDSHFHDGITSQRVNLSDLFPSSDISQTSVNPFYNFMMWGQASLTSGTVTITDSRIKSTSTVLLTGDSAGTSVLLFAFPVSNGSAVIGSTGTSSTAKVYYLIIF